MNSRNGRYPRRPGTPAPTLMVPTAWAYVVTHIDDKKKYDRSATAVRFRNALEDTKDAVYIFVAIAVGLGRRRQSIEEVLGSRAKRWNLEAEDRDPEGGTSITYYVRLKKSQSPNRLLDELRERLGGRLAHLHQAPKADQDTR